ncbi:MAG: DUF3179 domain-containing protein [Chloroflexi bacterium]|nr:DUF3179 domain-containing protein [Chloroflexota bacterium]
MRKILMFGLVVAVSGCSATYTTPTVTREEVSSESPAKVATVAGEAVTAQPSSDAALDHSALLDRLLISVTSRAEAQEILDQIIASQDTGFVAGLIDVMRFQTGLSQELGAALNALTGQNLPPDWFEWVEWAGKHPEIESFPKYTAWKADLLAQIDPNFQRFIYDGVKIDPNSRLEEVEWGGVLVDGIPALDNPKMIDPSEADYLIPKERVFGVSINGDTRAYPARFLDWHEMFNDIVGGEPVSLAY